jgi:hypothetical protein
MRHSLVVSMMAGLASAALATGAMAQSLSDAGVAHPPVSRAPGADPRANYDWHVTMLKKKMSRLTRQDGGQLSAAHQASLQKELDDLNRRYGAGPYGLGPSARKRTL